MNNKIKTNGTIIDLSVYVTQARYAAQHGYKLGTVSQWIKRIKDGQKAGKQLEFIDVDELGITLVKL